MMEDDVLNDPSQSEWLRSALRSALGQDPVQAANDAQFLAFVLLQRASRPHAVQPPAGGLPTDAWLALRA